VAAPALPLATHSRRFVISGAITAIARCSPKWDKAYNRRSSAERVNSRIDKLLCFERHSIRGQRKMKVAWALGSR
jgi:hypothetical protein